MINSFSFLNSSCLEQRPSEKKIDQMLSLWVHIPAPVLFHIFDIFLQNIFLVIFFRRSGSYYFLLINSNIECQCNGHGFCAKNTTLEQLYQISLNQSAYLNPTIYKSIYSLNRSEVISDPSSCSVCLHNSIGEHCEMCDPLFFGNAANGGKCSCMTLSPFSRKSNRNSFC